MTFIVSLTHSIIVASLLWPALVIGLILCSSLILLFYQHKAHQRKRQILSDEVQRLGRVVEYQQGSLEDQRHELQLALSSASEQPLNSVRQELTRANQDIEIFLYKAYHNFLGPIATIRGICNVATMEAKEDASLDYFDKVNAVADNMQQMLEQLLEVSVIRDRELIIESVALEDLLVGIEQELISNTSYHTVRILPRFSTQALLAVDRFLLNQAVVKMVSNTVPFRRTGFEDYLELHITHERDGGREYLNVKDIHLKMPEELNADIFRMFHRGTQRSDDHGLGLYTARYAMRRMGGDIMAVSGGFSTTFRLQLPAQFMHEPPELTEALAAEEYI